MLNNKSQNNMSASNFFINHPKLSIGMLSNQNSQQKLNKGKLEKQKHQISKTICEFQTFRTETQNSPNKINKNKYHLNTLFQQVKLKCKYICNNIKLEKQKKGNSDLSVRMRNFEDEKIDQILRSLKLIGQQMNQNKITQIKQNILSLWYNQLNQNCDKLINIFEHDYTSNIYQSSIQFDNQLLKQLKEERNNRLLVEQQTSIIIQSQEQQIKQYIETIKLLEQKLLNSM